MKRKLSARELEIRAASARPLVPMATPPSGEAMLMLARRGLRPGKVTADAPFPNQPDDELAGGLSELLNHYSFRLFLRGAIQKSAGFTPVETTRYLTPSQSKHYSEALVNLGLAQRLSENRYKLNWPVGSFGGVLEWYIGRELEKRLGFDVLTGIKLHAHGVGGDLDVVAAAEGKLVYLEVKSSPPKNLSKSEVAAFYERLHLLHPDLSLFVVDTALRLTDKILPMMLEEFERRRGDCAAAPKQITRQLWMLTPRLYVVSGRRDLMANIGHAIAAGLLALSPAL